MFTLLNKRVPMNFRRICLTAQAVVCWAVPVAAAETRLVPQQYGQIQAAIDASAPGDIVLVSAGTYAGPIDMKGKAICLQGVDADAVTVRGGSPVLRLTTGETTATVIQNMTITGGAGASGGGVLMQSASATIRNCRIIGNTLGAGGQGAGIMISGGAPVVDGCQIGANQISSYFNDYGDAGIARGAGICISGSKATIRNCLISGNQIYATCGANAMGMVAPAYGAGVHVVGDQVTLFDNCVFATNILNARQTSGNNGGFCNAQGVAMYCEAPVRVTRCTFRRNANYGCGGGGLAAAAFANPLSYMDQSIFCENSVLGTAGPYIDLGGNAFPSSCSACREDLDSNGVVDTADVSLLLLSFGPCEL